MSKCVKFCHRINLIFYITLVSSLESTYATVNHGNTYNPEAAKDPSGDYLIIHNARRYCEGPSIIRASDQMNAEDALDRCDGMSDCAFFCQTMEKTYNVSNVRIVRGSIEKVMSKGGDQMHNSSANWLCSGDGWNGLYVKNGWTTGVKGDAIRKYSSEYDFTMNRTADCSDGNLLGVSKSLPLKESINRCKKIKDCSFFVLTFEVRKKSMALETTTKFCKGEPVNVRVKDGNLFVRVRIEGDVKALDQEAAHERKIRPLYYYGGPLTSDHYYDDKEAGTLVPATRI